VGQAATIEAEPRADRATRELRGGPVVRSGGHRDDLQGLRAVAVLLVVGGHAGIGFLPGGYVGVDVFFVLSGFLITQLLLSRAAKHHHVSFREFYVRRARRILPAATLTLVVTQVVAWQLLNFVRAKQVMLDTIWAAAFSANIHFAHLGTNYFERGQPPSPVQHYWSLAVEEQFYLVWPALLSLVVFGALRWRSPRHRGAVSRSAIRRLLAVVVIAALASLAWSIHETATNPTSSYFSTFTRAWELALGAALAIGASGALRSFGAPAIVRLWGRARVAAGWLGLIAIAAAAVTFSDATPFPGFAALLPTLGAALVIAAGLGGRQPDRAAGRMLSLGPLRYIGDRSYAFYLWHWPVLIIASLYVGHDLTLLQNLLLICGAFVLSIVSYRFVENPIHRAEWSTEASASLWPFSFAAVVVVAAVAIGSLDSQALSSQIADSARLPVITNPAPGVAANSDAGVVVAAGSGYALAGVTTATAAARQGAPIPSGLDPPVDQLLNSNYSGPTECSAHDGQTSSAICRLGTAGSRRTIVVFGDSHAEMWMPAILSLAQRDGWAVIPLSKSACTPMGWAQGNAECRAWYSWAVNRAKALRPDVLLVTGCCGGFTGSDGETVLNQFVSLARTTKAFSRHVVVVADDVGVATQPVDCLLRRHASMKSCTTTWPADRFSLNEDIAVKAKLHGFGFINTSGWFCFQRQCPMVVGRTIVYTDTGHITAQYAQALAGPFRASFQRVLSQ